MLLCLCKYYQGCSNYDHGLTLTPFYANVKFGHIGFCIGKSENNIFWKLLQPWASKLLEAFN